MAYVCIGSYCLEEVAVRHEDININQKDQPHLGD